MSCTPINQLLTAELIAELTDAQVQAIYEGRATVNVVEITADTTYNKPANLLYALVACIGAGGGGAAGRQGLINTTRCGGGGGASGSIVRRSLSNLDIPASVAVTIGLGGAGGAAVTAGSTNGNPGAEGGDTTFGALLIAPGGNGGNGGTTAASVTGGAVKALTDGLPDVFPLYLTASTGGSGNSTNGASGGASGMFAALGNSAPGGGGLTSANAQGNGGAGSRLYDKDGVLSTSAAAGIAPGGDGGVGTDNVSLQILDQFPFTPSVWNTKGLGSSGGGGAGHATDAGGDGGNGGLYGGPGGGGGAGLDLFASGKGGDGADGLCIIVEVIV